jgi:hypothetical protein
MPANAKWLFWLAAIVLLLLATLVAAGIVSMTAPWLLPAGLLSLVLALVPVWGPPAP